MKSKSQPHEEECGRLFQAEGIVGADTWGQETAWGKRNACHFSVARLEMQDKEGQEVGLERWAAAKPCRPRVSWEVWVCGNRVGWKL